MRLLLVEDDVRLSRALKRGLEAEGFAVDLAQDGDEGWWLAAENAYDAMVLDVMLPGRQGTDICRGLRAKGNWTPILMLTAKDAPEDEAAALDSGADDFLGKPFAYVVLLARIRALLRRGGADRAPVLEVGELRLDPASHQAWSAETEIPLTPRQFSLLELMMRREGEVLSKRAILDHVWDFAFEGDPNIVEVYVSQVRQRLREGGARQSIETVRGVGYRLAERP